MAHMESRWAVGRFGVGIRVYGAVLRMYVAILCQNRSYAARSPGFADIQVGLCI